MPPGRALSEWSSGASPRRKESPAQPDSRKDDDGTFAERIPERWVDDLAIAGDPAECAGRLQRLFDAGSDSIGLWLFPTARATEILELTARDVLPRLEVSRRRAWT